MKYGKVGVIMRFFFFNDTATTEIYTLSLHDALPICPKVLITSAMSALVAANSGSSNRPP